MHINIRVPFNTIEMKMGSISRYVRGRKKGAGKKQAAGKEGARIDGGWYRICERRKKGSGKEAGSG